jgi:hypothetical protein
MGRTHLIGLDKPTKDPKATLEQEARKHETNRLESVAETIALVGAMTFQKALSGREQITVGGAGFQWGRGTAKAKTVAAHCLPGQLEFNSRPIQTMPDWNETLLRECGFKPLALSSKLRNISARTDVVDVIVNQTDSLLERMRDGRGLKPAFGRAVYGLMEQVPYRKPADWPEVEELVWESVNHYRQTASYACEERIDDLTKYEKVAVSGSDLKDIQNELIVAKMYLKVTQDASVVPEATKVTGFLQLMKDVIQDFRY